MVTQMWEHLKRKLMGARPINRKYFFVVAFMWVSMQAHDVSCGQQFDLVVTDVVENNAAGIKQNAFVVLSLESLEEPLLEIATGEFRPKIVVFEPTEQNVICVSQLPSFAQGEKSVRISRISITSGRILNTKTVQDGNVEAVATNEDSVLLLIRRNEMFAARIFTKDLEDIGEQEFELATPGSLGVHWNSDTKNWEVIAVSSAHSGGKFPMPSRRLYLNFVSISADARITGKASWNHSIDGTPLKTWMSSDSSRVGLTSREKTTIYDSRSGIELDNIVQNLDGKEVTAAALDPDSQAVYLAFSSKDGTDIQKVTWNDSGIQTGTVKLAEYSIARIYLSEGAIIAQNIEQGFRGIRGGNAWRVPLSEFR